MCALGCLRLKVNLRESINCNEGFIKCDQQSVKYADPGRTHIYRRGWRPYQEVNYTRASEWTLSKLSTNVNIIIIIMLLPQEKEHNIPGGLT